VAYLIFGGDMLVMAFMIAVVAWVSVRANDANITAAARIPLDDERPSLPVGAASAATRHSANGHRNA
jgi:cbb3-type cytochrome oxidase subunit 3